MTTTTRPDPRTRRLERAERYENRIVHAGPVGRLGARIGLAVLDRTPAPAPELQVVPDPADASPMGRFRSTIAEPAPAAAADEPVVAPDPPPVVTDGRLPTADITAAVVSAGRRLPEIVAEEAKWDEWISSTDADRADAELTASRRSRLLRHRPGRRHPS